MERRLHRLIVVFGIDGPGADRACHIARRFFRLTVVNLGSGSGVVDGPGITCTSVGGTSSGTCSGDFLFATSVDLTVAPTGASSFAGWGGACSGQESMCTAFIQGDTVVEATFLP